MSAIGELSTADHRERSSNNTPWRLCP